MEKPILFNTDMVRAILDGRKTATRRVIKQDKYEAVLSSPIRLKNPDIPDEKFIKCLCTPPCEIDDILYVRETFFEYKGRYYYKADGKHKNLDTLIGGSFFKWRPSIHMPKEAARIFLRVKDVKVERLHKMCLIDCLKEGVQLTTSEQSDLVVQGMRARDRFAGVWDSTIKPADMDKYGWKANPWVWVIEFQRMEKELKKET